MTWYYANEGNRVGPIDEAEFEALVDTGVITATTLVWNETLANWMRYADFAQQHTPQTSASPLGEDLTGAADNATDAPQPETPRVQRFGKNVSAGAPETTDSTSSFGTTAVCSECGKTFEKQEMIRFQNVWVCASCKPIFIQKMKEGVRMSGVVEYAGFWIRFVAKLIDGIISGIIGGVAGGIFGYLGATSGFSFLFMANNLLGIAIGVAYTTYFLGKYGATPGKMALKLKVIRSDGQPITYGRGAGRYFAEILSSLILLIGYIMAGFDEEKRALHDRICDTRVIKA